MDNYPKVNVPDPDDMLALANANRYKDVDRCSGVISSLIRGAAANGETHILMPQDDDCARFCRLIAIQNEKYGAYDGTHTVELWWRK